MKQFTLNDFYNRLDYLTEKGTLEELLDFLEVQCVGVSNADKYFNGITPKNMLLRGRCNLTRTIRILGYALLRW